MPEPVTLLMSRFVTHDVRRFILTRPEGFTYEPGQGVELAINDPQWKDQARPFTPTSLLSDHVLEFIIKKYPGHDAVTEQLHELQPGAELLIGEPFGTIKYRGPGVFIAGGAGVTPFIAMLRGLARDGELDGHTLIFSNKTRADIVFEHKLQHYLGDRCILTLTRERAEGYLHQHVNKAFIAHYVKDLTQLFYVCGPSTMVEQVNAALGELGVPDEQIVYER